MPNFISALDDDYISMKSAAELIAAERPELRMEAVMDTFVHGIFVKEFEPPELSPLRRNQAEWALHLRIERPLPDAATRALPVEHQPHDCYAVGAATILQLLHSRGALPGDTDAEPGSARSEAVEPGAAEKALTRLAATSFAAFPETGRAILSEILLSRDHLREWMLDHEYHLPAFLSTDSPQTEDIKPEQSDETSTREKPARVTSKKAARGRPPKAAWDRITQIVRDLHTKYPTMKLSALALDAYREAMREFDEIHLPSPSTIERSMKSIIGS